MNLILLGAPGSGKGTQAEAISTRLSIPIISTGAILREAVANGTELGLKAGEYMKSGELVPDELILSIVKERLSADDCNDGYILDGVPRTVAQAEFLDEIGIAIDRVIELSVPDKTIVKRLGGRRVCSSCGSSYHVDYKKPAVEGVCDNCKGALVTREDDNPKTVRERLRVYHKQTEPLIDFYQKRGKLRVVEGQEDIKDTVRLTFAAIEG